MLHQRLTDLTHGMLHQPLTGLTHLISYPIASDNVTASPSRAAVSVDEYNRENHAGELIFYLTVPDAKLTLCMV